MIYTVGHSNLSIDVLISLLQQYEIKALVDVRAYPHSKRFEQYNQAPLRERLELAQITYHWAGRQLGGMRKSSGLSKHSAIESESLRAYADHMETELFHRSVMHLIHLSQKTPLAVMCAEKDPNHCHRSLLSDYLVHQGQDILHLQAEGVPQPHRLNALARRESQALVYDRMHTGELDF